MPLPGLMTRALDAISEAAALTDLAGLVVFWNTAAEKLFGWTAEETLGRNVLEVLASEATKDQMTKVPDQLIAGGSWEGEFPVRHRDGSSSTALVTNTAMVDDNGHVVGTMTFARDLLALRQAQQDAAKDAGMFEALIHGSNELLAIVDREGLIRYVAGPCEAMLGVDAGELRGLDLFELITPADAERARALWAQRVDSRAPMKAEDFWTQRSDGAWVCLNVLVSNHLDNPAIAGVVVTARDVTENRQLERARTAMSAGSAALFVATDEDELFSRICSVVVGDATYSLAWIGLGDPSASLGVRLIACAPNAGPYFEALEHLAERGDYDGPLTKALANRELYVVQDIDDGPDTEPWRQLAHKYGYCSMVALPLPFTAEDWGVLAIYSGTVNAFSDDAVNVLQQLATDLTFGAAALRTRAQRSAYKARFEASLEAVVGAIATAAELRDPYTAGHQRRVAELATAIGAELGLDPEVVRGIGVAASIHDVGKLAIPAEILSKPGPFSATESALVHEHVQAGYDIVAGIDFPGPVAEMILQHHERLDGSGYPNQLRGDAILLGARIIAVSDTIEAMTSHRPYRPAIGIRAALDEIAGGRDTRYDPSVVDACTRLFREQHFTFTPEPKRAVGGVPESPRTAP